MSELEPPPLPAVEVEAAAALRRLAMALLGRNVDPALTARVAKLADELAAEVEASSPIRTKAEAFLRYTGQQRVQHFITNGRWPPPPPDGSSVTFDTLSFVGGGINPFSAGARYFRDGEGALARVTLDAGFEGPPGRAHGGMVASIFDEVMGTVFRVGSLPSAFTGSLNVRFERPAPLGVELEFRARLAGVEGRKYTIEAEATGPDGRFASATAVFIEMAAEHLAAAYGAIAEQAAAIAGQGAIAADQGAEPAQA